MREVEVRFHVLFLVTGAGADKSGVAEESSRAAYLGKLYKELESDKDIEKEEGVEEVEEAEDESSRAASHESDGHGEASERRVIRFEDGDMDNPNNCKPYLVTLFLETLANMMLPSRVYGMKFKTVVSQLTQMLICPSPRNHTLSSSQS